MSISLNRALKSFKFFLHYFHNIVGRDAEVLIQLIGWSGSAKSAHADKAALVAQPLIPAEAAGGLNTDTDRSNTQNLSTIIVGLLCK